MVPCVDVLNKITVGMCVCGCGGRGCLCVSLRCVCDTLGTNFSRAQRGRDRTTRRRRREVIGTELGKRL